LLQNTKEKHGITVKGRHWDRDVDKLPPRKNKTAERGRKRIPSLSPGVLEPKSEGTGNDSSAAFHLPLPFRKGGIRTRKNIYC